MELFHLSPGKTPVLVSVPHAGTYLPVGIAGRLTEIGRRLPDTDWFVDRLWEFAEPLGAGLLAATHSRYVVDLNRAPGGEALYGAPAPPVPLESFDDEPLYRSGLDPDAAEVGRRIADYWTPYHEALASELERLRGIHGHAMLIDAHSIRSRVPRLFEGRLPDLNLGSFRGRSADPDLIRRAHAGLAADGDWQAVLDGRFVGGYITRRYGQPEQGVHALQLELSQRTYLDERTGAWDQNAAATLQGHLQSWLEELLEWRPFLGGEDGD